MAAVSISDLQKYVGKPITDICENEFSTTKQNHCAHFVGHVMEIQLGMLCGDMKYKTRKTGGSIRCDELYNRLSQRGPWEERPTQSDGVLIFALAVHNVVNGIMLKVPEKHVGIHYAGRVYNFSNSQHKVVADVSVDAFHKKFKAAYAGNVALFYGVVP